MSEVKTIVLKGYITSNLFLILFMKQIIEKNKKKNNFFFSNSLKED